LAKSFLIYSASFATCINYSGLKLNAHKDYRTMNGLRRNKSPMLIQKPVTKIYTVISHQSL